MPDVTTHPSAQALALFGHGRLPQDQAAVIAAHLATCPDCCRAVAALPPDLPPELAGHPKFRILRQLGKGGMGVIYLAEHRILAKLVALKVINPAVLDNPAALARFEAEVRAAGKLDHPNIARAYDADQAGGLHFLVMEYVEGMSLAQVLEKRGPLPVTPACHYARQAALGLQHAFEQGMVHRDIKPHNLMLAPKGVVKVLDFGLARVRGDRAPRKGLTQADAFMGTPEYVAPEQATDARNADTRSDVYSLGCTLYALLTGRPPFQENTMVKLVLAHIEKEPKPLHEVRPDVPAELSAVVARMLAKDPAKRFQRPAEVAQALAPFVRPTGKPAAAGAAPVSPGAVGAGTVLGGDTSRLKGLSKAAPKPPAGEPQATQGVSPFRDLDDAPATGAAPKRGKRQREAAGAAPAAWWKRPPVLAGAAAAALALGLLMLWAAGALLAKMKDGTLIGPGRPDVAGAKGGEGTGPGPDFLDQWFAVGTKWEGKKGGTQPNAVERSVWFTVLSRDGNKFKGRLVDETRLDLAVEGVLGDDGTSFRWTGARQAPNLWTREIAIASFAAEARCTAERARVDWKLTQKDGRVGEGFCEFTARTDGPRKGDAGAWPARLRPRLASPDRPGKWRVKDGELIQDEFLTERVGDAWPTITFGDLGWQDYSFHLKAMRTAGDRGFIILFDVGRRQTRWCIGLAGNRQTYVEIFEPPPAGAGLTPVGGRKDASVETNEWYDLLVKAHGEWIECELDGQAVLKVPRPDRSGGAVGLTCPRLAGRFKDIEVTAPDGQVLWEGPPELP